MSKRAREALARVEAEGPADQGSGVISDGGGPTFRHPLQSVRIARLEAELARVEREAREAMLANEAELRRADAMIGRLRAVVRAARDAHAGWPEGWLCGDSAWCRFVTALAALEDGDDGE